MTYREKLFFKSISGRYVLDSFRHKGNTGKYGVFTGAKNYFLHIFDIFSSFIIEIKLVWRLCRQKHLAAYWKWEIKMKKIINIYHCLLKKSFCVKSLTICIRISHQASQRTGNTLKIDLYTCSQSYFLWTLSSTFKVISIFHYKPRCSKIQFCPLYASTTKTIQTWLNCSFKSPLCTDASISCKIHTEYVCVF